MYKTYLNLACNRVTSFTNFARMVYIRITTTLISELVGTDSETESIVTIGGKRIFWNNWNGNRKSYPLYLNFTGILDIQFCIICLLCLILSHYSIYLEVYFFPLLPDLSPSGAIVPHLPQSTSLYLFYFIVPHCD